MTIRPLILVAVLLAQGLVPGAAAAADATLAGTAISPSPLVPGGTGEVTVTLRAGAKPTVPVKLEVRVGDKPIGKLEDASLAANQSKAYRIPIKVPADAAKTLELKIVGWGIELGHVSAAVKAPSPARPSGPPPLPSLTQTVTTPRASMTGNRGAQPLPPPPPSLTQMVTTPAASMTGNRGAQPLPPPPPSLTQTVTTPSASMTGNR